MSDPILRLRDALTGLGRVHVAVSGGVDSLTLAAAAHAALGGAARMHHATSPAVPPDATARCRELAAARGWALEVFDAGEFADPRYRANPSDRCFFCKTNLYGAIAARVDDGGVIVSGTNTDDLGDWRPGLRAAADHGVRHPFVEAGIGKADVRTLARRFGLGEVADLPAAPCLSSRIETGLRVEPALLALVHGAERLVRDSMTPETVRCRVRADGLVIELDAAALARLPAFMPALGPALDVLADGRPVRFAPYQRGSAFLR